MINFIVYSTEYKCILDSLINPIAQYIPEYTMSKQLEDDAFNISLFREYKPHRDVFMSHGIADKNWRNYQHIKDYDYIFVSGDFWKSKLILQGCPESKVFVVGYAKLDDLFNSTPEKNTYEKSVILYAPTHSAIESVSLQGRFTPYLEMLSEKYEVLISRHPAEKQTGEITYQELIDADVIISDSGSIVYEAWALGKQVVFPDWLVKDGIINTFKGSFEDYIYTKQIGIHADENNIEQCIEYALTNPLDSRTQDFIEGIFPTRLRGCSGKAHADVLIKLAGE